MCQDYIVQEVGCRDGTVPKTTSDTTPTSFVQDFSLHEKAKDEGWGCV